MTCVAIRITPRMSSIRDDAPTAMGDTDLLWEPMLVADNDACSVEDWPKAVHGQTKHWD